MKTDEAEYPVKCSNTTFRFNKDCNWTGKVKDCTIIRDTDFGRWYVYVKCPECGSTCIEINHNTSTNHPLYNI